jgi:hypothetical protein|tara:strand:+ start:225 stop:491 length:267 start_codon:yes stop_codon:yes gene_type:complete
MKTRKLMLPMMAFICAIGMAFATNAIQQDPMNDYIRKDGSWEAIQEVNCEPGSSDCQALVEGEGPFTVYDAQDLNSAKPGNGVIIILP